MSSDVIISVEGLSKSYLIGHDGPPQRYRSLRDTLVQHGKNYVRKAVDMASGRQIIQGDSVEEFWALKDVSFEIKRGELIGIIGRNGAGKSTLLKILSRITEPTTGRVVLDGRVASLLEVGTGFHPELTGRENIFLNGAILGMSKVEIRSKFDEIVAFAEVDRFLDTPVKRYSSGMYVRLAFAVAAHLEPEILILDEVLAVGDADFQRKCLGKMNAVAHQGGRTVIFVSHNLASVQQLCDRVIVLKQGKVVCDADATTSIAYYLSQSQENNPQEALVGRMLGSDLELREFKLSSATIEAFGDASIELALHAENSCSIFELCILITNASGQRVGLVDLRTHEGTYALQSGQNLIIHTQLSRLALIPGSYDIGFFIRTDRHMQDYLGLKSINVLARVVSQSWASYGAEYLGTTALDAAVSSEITF